MIVAKGIIWIIIWIWIKLCGSLYTCFVSRGAVTSVTAILKKVAMAMENGEYDFDGSRDAKVTIETGTRSQK